MKKILSKALFVCAIFILQNASAQYGSFGEDNCPSDSTAVDDLIFYGEMLDMSNGYQVGETVFDFTVYDFDGNALNLYEELSATSLLFSSTAPFLACVFVEPSNPAMTANNIWQRETIFRIIMTTSIGFSFTASKLILLMETARAIAHLP